MTLTVERRRAFDVRPRTSDEWKQADRAWEEDLTACQVKAISRYLSEPYDKSTDEPTVQLARAVIAEICELYGSGSPQAPHDLGTLSKRLLEQEPNPTFTSIAYFTLEAAVYPFKSYLSCVFFPWAETLAFTELLHLSVWGKGATFNAALRSASINFHELYVEMAKPAQSKLTNAHHQQWLDCIQMIDMASYAIWQKVCDTQDSIGNRLEQLSELVSLDDDPVASYVATCLIYDNVDVEWRNALILFAEHLQFEDSEIREKLTSGLIHVAEQHAFSIPNGREDVALAAIRLAASMIDVSNLDYFLVLLGPTKSFDTRLATLLALIRILATDSPPQKTTFAIADRCFQLSQKFTDPDLVSPGVAAGIGVAAITALAALGDDRTRLCIDHVIATGITWHAHGILDSLEDLYDSWQRNCKSEECLVGLASLINRLRSSLK